jgi:processive 1,2-diacylglycerol beta-glucosyltransferase
MAKKVLISYASGGMGHVMAARAIEQAFKRKYPEVEVKNVNVIDFANKPYKFFFVDGYNWVSAHAPWLWGWLYQTFNTKSRQGFPSWISRICIAPRFIPFIREFKPDFIISTHPLPMLIVSYSKAKDVIDILSSMVCTDFGCHSFWVDPQVNYYFGAVDNVAKCLVDYGVKNEQIAVTGIPIEEKYSLVLSKEELIKKHNLANGLFTILIVGGQFKIDALKMIINSLIDKHDGKIQFLVVAGRDNNLKEALDKTDLNKRFANVKVFGFIDYMHELMTVSDLIFSKAGGLTVSECMAKGLPMVINKVIPGQEEDNVEYLVSHNAAVKASNVEEIVLAIDGLIGNPNKVAAMKESARSIGRSNSSEKLADFVYEKINES